ncbi:Methyl-CpG-binding domain protein 4 [Dinochytrium kinnereticum]|nr:Methyl-CpG-binding domain protein 4 [Dinochytrium kinnereticum]
MTSKRKKPNASPAITSATPPVLWKRIKTTTTSSYFPQTPLHATSTPPKSTYFTNPDLDEAIADDGRDWVGMAERGVRESLAVQRSLPLAFEVSVSPIGLIQEKLKGNPWQLLVATVFLNRTRGCQAKPVLWDFFESFPSPEACAEASVSVIAEIIHPLGMQTQRAKRLIQFSKSFIENPHFSDPRSLPGIGKYGYDSWRLFCGGGKDDYWRGESGDTVRDKELVKYVAWRRRTEEVKS